MSGEGRVQCPGCGDIHPVGERLADGGRRVCPECDEPTAFIVDERPGALDS